MKRSPSKQQRWFLLLQPKYWRIFLSNQIFRVQIPFSDSSQSSAQKPLSKSPKNHQNKIKSIYQAINFLLNLIKLIFIVSLLESFVKYWKSLRYRFLFLSHDHEREKLENNIWTHIIVERRRNRFHFHLKSSNVIKLTFLIVKVIKKKT